MRIISGNHKGRRLTAPKNLPVRPTTDMAKEALFNILSNRFLLEQAHVLDLFSGTGNMSFEFASRGTEHITAVDKHIGCTNYISKISKDLGLEIKVVKLDVFKFLEKATLKSDIIFADPPYSFDLEQFGKIPEIIFKNNLLLEGGVLIVEHSIHTDISNIDHFVDSRKYGSSQFSFFEI